MTFDEWLAANYARAGGAPLLARAAWDAGAAAERERCALHVESVPPQHALDRIRRGDAVVVVPAAVWTTTPPDREGWWWSRPVGGVAECVHVTRAGDRLCVIYHDEAMPPAEYAKWYGGEWWPTPLEAPPC